MAICLIKFFDLSLSQKNLASANLASTTLLLPIEINFFSSFLFATTKKLFVNLPLLSNIGKYLWCFSRVEMIISWGIFKYSLLKLTNKTFGSSTIFTTSSKSFEFNISL